jgi:hypothetical protein
MHPGVVDKNIEATEGLDGSRNRFFRRGGVGHVGPNAHGLSPPGTNLFYAFAHVQEIGNHHGHAPGSQGCRNTAADASRTAGYQGHINDFGFRHVSSSSGAAPKNWFARSIVTRVFAAYNSRSPNSHCLFDPALLWNFAAILPPVQNVFFLARPEIWQELIDPKSVVKAF